MSQNGFRLKLRCPADLRARGGRNLTGDCDFEEPEALDFWVPPELDFGGAPSTLLSGNANRSVSGDWQPLNFWGAVSAQFVMSADYSIFQTRQSLDF